MVFADHQVSGHQNLQNISNSGVRISKKLKYQFYINLKFI